MEHSCLLFPLHTPHTTHALYLREEGEMTLYTHQTGKEETCDFYGQADDGSVLR